MDPVEFDGFNVTFAKDQPEYRALPAHAAPDGRVTTCWKLTRLERLKILFTGRLWFQQLTFREPLQPQLPLVDRPLLEDV